jgi:hypothetical protein
VDARDERGHDGGKSLYATDCSARASLR